MKKKGFTLVELLVVI
ncbi:prepilin-type N-terminal cleavage/methylation domain-containing protein, partial [bacterium]|nr:prepilin-type N-terminal cleavage/methylation domain-containing protein [bacterium]